MRDNTPTTVITGGGSGMGKAIALRLADRGQHVQVVRRRPKPLEAVAAQASEGLMAIVSADGATTLAQRVAERGVIGIVAAAGGQGDFLTPAADAYQAEKNWNDALRKNLMSAVLPIEALAHRSWTHAGVSY